MTDTSYTLDRIWKKHLSSVEHWAALIQYGEIKLEVNADMVFSGASMIKSFILEIVASKVNNGEISWNDTIEISQCHRAGGDGILKSCALPQSLTLEVVSNLMITISDNTATNAVIDFLGGTQLVNQQIAELGYPQSKLCAWIGGTNRDPHASSWLPHASLPTRTGISRITVSEHFSCIDKLLDDDHCRQMLENQQDYRSLARYIVADLPFAHKTGTADGLRHDGGVLVMANGRILKVHCLTDGPSREETLDDPACLAIANAMKETLQLFGASDYLSEEVNKGLLTLK